jgi:hypothetical protein
MKTTVVVGFALLVLLPLGSQQSALSSARRASPVQFEELGLHLEVDLPTFEGWERFAASRSLLDLPAELVLEAKSAARVVQIRIMDAARDTRMRVDCPRESALGVSELTLETGGVTLGEMLQDFAPGEYLVEALTADGQRIQGTVELSSLFPGPFLVLSPLPGEAVAAGDVTISWTPSARASAYVLEIEQEELGFTYETKLAAWDTSCTIPEQILRPGECYEYSLVVEGDTDNELELEGSFVTGRGARSTEPAQRAR